MKTIDILYTTDKNYLKLMLVSLNSLLLNNSHLEEINIHIIFENLIDKDLELIERVLNSYNNCNLFLYDYSLINTKIDKYSLPRWRNSNIANARLFFSYVINTCDNLLYLDSDTLVLGKLDDLDEYENNSISAVLDHLSKDYWSNLDNRLQKYCNSGVLWINRNLWENNNCNDLILSTIKDKYKLTYPDQDILNIALKDYISLLPPEYNISPNEYFYNNLCLKKYYTINNIDYYNIKDVISAKKNPVIVHMTEFYGQRPWINNNIYPLNDLFIKYNNMIKEINEQEFEIEEPNNIFKLVHYMKMYTPKNIKEQTKKILIKK